MKRYTKEELVNAIREIAAQGWHPSVKKTINMRNDGAVGNTLEHLLGLPENNLPIPNAQEWELKGQRLGSTSLVTLNIEPNIEPSPRSCKIVTTLLLPCYGWKHKLAGSKYPETEKSFRATISASSYTNRSFRLVVEREENKPRLTFDDSQARYKRSANSGLVTIGQTNRLPWIVRSRTL